MSSLGFLSEYYAPLTRNSKPFYWQRQLFEQLCRGELPDNIDLPTGSGKTSLISLWLLALAWQSLQGEQVTLPRRLIWVVDRRVVVDQATDEAEGLNRRLAEPSLVKVREGLARLCCLTGPDENPLSVSTLRGEREDNREWSRNPTRPAIVVGTVDMIGRRLLFLADLLQFALFQRTVLSYPFVAEMTANFISVSSASQNFSIPLFFARFKRSPAQPPGFVLVNGAAARVGCGSNCSLKAKTTAACKSSMGPPMVDVAESGVADIICFLACRSCRHWQIIVYCKSRVKSGVLWGK